MTAASPYIVTIAKRFTFDAAHRLDQLPPEHKCHHLHGHTYEVEVVLAGLVGPNGFLVDYQVIADAWEHVHVLVDHKYLNEVEGLPITSTERLAGWIAGQLAPRFPALSPTTIHTWAKGTTLLTHVRVKESSSTWCEVAVEDLHATGSVARPWLSAARSMPQWSLQR